MKIEGGPGEIENVQLHRDAVAGGGGGLGHGGGGGGAGGRTRPGQTWRTGRQGEEQDPATATTCKHINNHCQLPLQHVNI